LNSNIFHIKEKILWKGY